MSIPASMRAMVLHRPGEALRLGEHDDTIPLGRVYAKVFAEQ